MSLFISAHSFTPSWDTFPRAPRKTMAARLTTSLGDVMAQFFGQPNSQGEMIVALQGKSANHDVITEWEPTCRALAAAGHHVVLPDLHSNPSTKPGTIRPEGVAEIVLSAVAQTGATSIALLGKSWGGGEAVIFAAAHRSLVSKLVLVAPSLSVPERISEIATLPTLLFWAHDDPVKAFDLSADFTSQLERCSFQPSDSGGHRVLPEHCQPIVAFLATLPGELKAQALTGNRDMAEDLEREPCGTCTRSFAPSVLVRHEPMCAARATKAAAKVERG